MKAKVVAKLNLLLNVSNTIIDNYHMLESVMINVDIYDTVEFTLTNNNEVSVYMDTVPAETNNTALVAARLICDYLQINSIRIDITKGIPCKAGMGGSSADAAAVIVSMAKMYNITDTKILNDIADRVGSDVCYMMQGGLAIVNGRGTQICRHNIEKQYYFVLVHSKYGLSTKQVFEKFDSIETPKNTANSNTLITAMKNGDTKQISQNISNNLINAAFNLQPELHNTYTILKSCNVLTVSMTGSGSSLFALCSNRKNAEETCKTLISKGYNAVMCKSLDTANSGVTFIRI